VRKWHPYVSWVGHRVREAAVHADRLRQSADLPRILFSVGNDNRGDSSGLRGYAIARELKKYGWRTAVIPKQLELSQRQRLVRLERPDIIVLQKGRHQLNRPKYYANTTCVFDVDDADFLDPAHRKGTIECMANSSAVIAGSTFVADFARKYNPRVEVIWTGSTPISFAGAQKPLPPVVAYAVSNASLYPRECELVVSSLARVRRKDWQFWLFGVSDPIAGQRTIQDLQDKGISCRLFPLMNYRKFLKTMEMVSIGLAPLVSSSEARTDGKSFGKILSYLSSGAATIASNLADHPLFFKHGVNGYLASSPNEFAECVELLLSDGELRDQIARRAYRDYVDKLSTHAAARRMDSFMRKLFNHDVNQGPTKQLVQSEN
jgi:glycosyltransferase involved in cell wall biosynthesis